MKPTFSDLLHPHSRPNIHVEREREGERERDRTIPSQPAVKSYQP
jgi:hypothetical protein